MSFTVGDEIANGDSVRLNLAESEFRSVEAE